ncbi:hypothetical protein MKY51_12070 [Solibacillus sp. FSL R5-0691]|uniref:hypothetical protein n=1 Tax=Solibacillus sp. FSL R5-0691 TaxID=2921653 RepID=UPI0030CAAD62
MVKLNSEDVKLLNRIFMLEMILTSCVFSSVFLFIEFIVDVIPFLSRYSAYTIIIIKSNLLSMLIYKMTLQQILYQDLREKQIDKLYSLPIKAMLYVSTLPFTIFIIDALFMGINIGWNIMMVSIIYILCFINSVLKARNYIWKKWSNENSVN